MIGAVVLAAGQSRRMGRPKMLLPWGETTVIGQVVRVLARGGVEDCVVVTGGAAGEVGAALQGLPARTVFNPRYTEEDMVFSLQAGLAELGPEVEAALVALGDQPQAKAGVVQAVIAAFRVSEAALVIPSYHMRRGHPWLLRRDLWPVVFALQEGETLRDFLNAHKDRILYLPVETPTVLRDLDTPEDYDRERPRPESPL